MARRQRSHRREPSSLMQYNGLVGTVISWDGAKGRAGVKLDNGEGGAGLMLKPANLLPSEVPRPRTPCIVWLHGLGDTGDRLLIAS